VGYLHSWLPSGRWLLGRATRCAAHVNTPECTGQRCAVASAYSACRRQIDTLSKQFAWNWATLPSLATLRAKCSMQAEHKNWAHIYARPCAHRSSIEFCARIQGRKIFDQVRRAPQGLAHHFSASCRGPLHKQTGDQCVAERHMGFRCAPQHTGGTAYHRERRGFPVCTIANRCWCSPAMSDSQKETHEKKPAINETEKGRGTFLHCSTPNHTHTASHTAYPKRLLRPSEVIATALTTRTTKRETAPLSGLSRGTYGDFQITFLYVLQLTRHHKTS
jgi:hypothetical protein